MPKKEMLVNTVEGVECRIAIVSGGALEELYVERVSSASRVGNIYKGRVTNVEAAIQAAFVDFGTTKNGFLHISDLHPQHFPKGKSSSESVGRKRRHRDRPPIQDCLRRGSEVIVQMTKEGIGTKGPTLTTYLSIPGRFLVMVPGMSKLGVSRKIEDPEARDKARELLAGMTLPPDMGFIVRTAGLNRGKRDLQRDLNYLLRLWKSVKKRINSAKAPAEIYQESDLVTRTVRDVYNTDVERIICDRQSVAMKIKEFLDMAMPRSKNRIEVYTGKEGLFHDYGLEDEIEKIYRRRVELRSGGSLVIDQTEALVAIDVNSGRFRQHTDAETTAVKINMEAAREISRQLRLRDMGGVIIIDFIDMRHDRNRRSVDKTLREAVKVDRAKTKINRISTFGIVEMTRQRVRPSLKDSIYRLCPSCEGSGVVKSEETLSLEIMRSLQRLCSNQAVAHMTLTVSLQVAQHLANYRRQQLVRLESDSGKTIVVEADNRMRLDEVRIACTNNRGSEVAWDQPPTHKPTPREIATVDVATLLAAKQQPAEKDQPAAPPAKPQAEAEAAPAGEKPPEQPPARKSRRRGRRGKRKSKSSGEQAATGHGDKPASATEEAPPPQPAAAEATQQAGDQPKKKRARRSRRRKKANAPPADAKAAAS